MEVVQGLDALGAHTAVESLCKTTPDAVLRPIAECLSSRGAP